MRTLKAVTPLFAVAALALAGCSDPSPKTDTGTSGADPQSSSDAAFDLSTLEPVPDIVTMVPEAVTQSGVLRNGASVDYAPAEFRDTDGQTPIGYDVDLTKALGTVMGLEGQTNHAVFDTIIPALGTKFDIGMSSFTITPERLEQVNMVSYVEVGSAYAVATGNPSKFDPDNVCGKTIGVQSGTFQFDYTQELSKECVDAGKEAVKMMPHELQTDVITKVVGGQYDATFADSTVVGYSVANSGGKLEQVGKVIESAPQGIAISKSDEQLTSAVQAAMQYLMDKGYVKQIMGVYGAEAAALKTSTINPQDPKTTD